MFINSLHVYTYINCFKGARTSAGINNSGLDESGVFADLVSTEATCLHILGSQSTNNADNLTMDQFTISDSKSMSDPTPGITHQHYFT